MLATTIRVHRHLESFVVGYGKRVSLGVFSSACTLAPQPVPSYSTQKHSQETEGEKRDSSQWGDVDVSPDNCRVGLLSVLHYI